MIYLPIISTSNLPVSILGGPPAWVSRPSWCLCQSPAVPCPCDPEYPPHSLANPPPLSALSALGAASARVALYGPPVVPLWGAAREHGWVVGVRLSASTETLRARLVLGLFAQSRGGGGTAHREPSCFCFSSRSVSFSLPSDRDSGFHNIDVHVSSTDCSAIPCRRSCSTVVHPAAR